jgi:cell division protein FtsQ
MAGAPAPTHSTMSRTGSQRARRPKAGARSNARRTPRAAVEAAAATYAPRPDPRSARGGGRGFFRTILRFGLRIGIAGGVAYGVLVGVREGYAFATTSPRFEVRALEFKATRHVDDARLRELLAITPGTNILALDLDGMAARIMAEPWVARAVVTRELPDALRVEVEEHVPVAVLAAGPLVLVGDDGEPFKRLEPGERGDLPVITGVDAGELLSAPERARPRIRRAIDAIHLYALKRRPRLSEVHVDEWSGVTLYTAEVGTQVRLGRGDMMVSLARFDALRAALGDESDKLAVAHLDGTLAPDKGERVVASFFPAKDVPKLLVESQERAAEEAAQRAAAAMEPQARAQAAERRERGPARRIPRHH